MSCILGVNAVFHDPAAALVIDGRIVAAAEEERFSRRKHGKRPVPFSTWELPEEAIRWCLRKGGVTAADLDAVAYSYDPSMAPLREQDVKADRWEGLRTLYAERAALFLKTLLPTLDEGRVRHVPHHVAHAASAYLGSPYGDCAVMVLDGRGESGSYLAGFSRQGVLRVLRTQALPHSLGLLYEEVTEHLGFLRSSDEYKVMALASYGTPRWLDLFRERVPLSGDGSFSTLPIALDDLVPRRSDTDELLPAHADLAASMQRRLEEVLLELARWLHAATDDRTLTMAGGVALNCVANSVLAAQGPFERIWVQPAAGDAGTALGAALYVAHSLGDRAGPMESAALGRDFTDQEIVEWLQRAEIVFERPSDLAEEVGEILAGNGVVGWFQGRSEFGPRALGQRSLLAHPGIPANLTRLNDIKGREQFRPIAPLVLQERAAEIFEGPLPSPHMLFVHNVKPEWRSRIPSVVHVDGTARVQTVDRAQLPLLARVLDAFERRSGLPVLINTSFNTAGRPMVDDPRDALECFGSAPISALAIGPCLARRPRIGSVDGGNGRLEREARPARLRRGSVPEPWKASMRLPS